MARVTTSVGSKIIGFVLQYTWNYIQLLFVHCELFYCQRNGPKAAQVDVDAAQWDGWFFMDFASHIVYRIIIFGVKICPKYFPRVQVLIQLNVRHLPCACETVGEECNATWKRYVQL